MTQCGDDRRAGVGHAMIEVLLNKVRKRKTLVCFFIGFIEGRANGGVPLFRGVVLRANGSRGERGYRRVSMYRFLQGVRLDLGVTDNGR